MTQAGHPTLGHGALTSGRGITKMTKRMNDYSVLLSQDEAVMFLSRSAREYEVASCTAPECEVCTFFVATWNDVFASLDQESQELLEKQMLRGEFVAPTGEAIW